jgi:hypothetical protein
MTTTSNRIRGRTNPADQLTAAGELRDGELDAVSGGVDHSMFSITKLLDSPSSGGGDIGGGGGAGPAINAWNKLLGNYGY